MARKSKKIERTGTRKETIKKRQDANKAKFIKKIEETPIIQVAAAQTGIDRTTYYRWRDEDPDFKKKCEEAQEKGIDFVNDMMESILIKNAKADNMTAVIFWLKNHNPLYNDKRYHEHKHRIEEENVLTEERKEQIANAIRAWYPDKDEYEDERDEDYEIPNEADEVKEKPEADEPAEVEEPTEIEESPKPPPKSRVAKVIKPKRLKK
jgi:hypothetical protein